MLLCLMHLLVVSLLTAALILVSVHDTCHGIPSRGRLLILLRKRKKPGIDPTRAAGSNS
jgi:hypothetical protein